MGIDPGHQKPSILPHGLPQGCCMSSCEQPTNQPGHYHKRRTIVLTAAKSKDILPLGAASLRWDVGPQGEQPRVHAAAVKGQCRDVELKTPVFFMGEQLLDQGTPVLPSRCKTLSQRPQHVIPALILNGTTIVRVNQAQIPQLYALIGIGHARGSDFQQSLGQRVEQAIVAETPLENEKII